MLDQFGVGFDAPGLQRPAVAGQPVAAGGQPRWAAEVENPPVALGEQVVGDGEGAALVVVLHLRGRGPLADARPPAQHQFAAVGVQRARPALQFGHVTAVLHAAADQDHRVRAALVEQFDEGQLALRVALRAADQAQPVATGRLPLHAARDVGVERVDHLVDHDADGAGRDPGERAGVRVDDVAEFAHGRLDPFPGGRGHRVVAVHDP